MLLYLSAQIAKVPSKETEWVTWFVSLFQVTLCVQDSTASFFYTNTSSACSMHLVFNPFGVEWDSVSQLIAPVGGTRVILITGWWFGTWIVFIHILGMSSSQLTNSIMFQRGRLKPPTRYKWVIIPWKQFDIIPPTETIVFFNEIGLSCSSTVPVRCEFIPYKQICFQEDTFHDVSRIKPCIKPFLATELQLFHYDLWQWNKVFNKMIPWNHHLFLVESH